MSHTGFIPQRVKRLHRSLLSSTSGNVLPLAAAGLILLTGLIGAGVDYGRVYKAQNRLQSACDAGVLAGRKGVTSGGYTTAASDQADKFFKVNFNESQQGTTNTTFTTSAQDNGSTIIGAAQTQVKMLMLSLPWFKQNTFTVSANCSAKMGSSNLDITFVLDTTGSMRNSISGSSSSKMTLLKNSVKNFYTTVNTATSSTTARVRYAFVPFSSTVNVGQMLLDLNPAYLTNTRGYQSRLPRYETTVKKRYASSSTYFKYTEEAFDSPAISNRTELPTSYDSMQGCLSAMPADTAWSDNGSSTSSSLFTGSDGETAYWTSTRRGGYWTDYTSGTQTNKVAQPQQMTSYTCQRNGDLYYVWSYKLNRKLNTYSYPTITAAVNDTQNTTRFDHFDYKMINYDVSAFKTFASVSTNTGANGDAEASTWYGCIEERATVSDSSFSYDAASGRITSTNAIDLDIDSAPTSSSNTKWAPMWDQIAYLRYTNNGDVSSAAVESGNYDSNATMACPAAGKPLQTFSASNFNAYVDTLTADGATYHDIGLLWGARLSSGTGIYSTLVNAAPSNGQTVSRHLIVETDGLPGAAYNGYQAYGIEAHDKRITDDGYTDDDARHISRFRAICDAVKAKGIRLWMIVIYPTSSSDFNYCASPDSIFYADDAAEVNTAFETIATTVGELRISQ